MRPLLLRYRCEERQGAALSQRTVLEIPELACRMCVRHVERALEGLTGVLNVEVDLRRREVTVEDDGSARREAVIQAVHEAGYRARVRRWAE